jgi:cell division protein ZapA
MKGVNVEIMGQDLVVTSESDDDWVKSLVEAVNEKIKAVRAGSKKANSVDVAILAALNFADELERLRRQHQELLDRVKAVTRRLGDAIDLREPSEHREATERS